MMEGFNFDFVHAHMLSSSILHMYTILCDFNAFSLRERNPPLKGNLPCPYVSTQINADSSFGHVIQSSHGVLAFDRVQN